MTYGPEDAENSLIFWDESKAVAWSNMVGRSNISQASAQRCRIRYECRPEMNAYLTVFFLYCSAVTF